MKTRVLFLALAVVACGEPAAPIPPLPVPPADPTPIPDHWSTVGAADAGTVSTDPSALGRRTRRMSVDQLRRSLTAVMGETWRVDGAGFSLYPFDLAAPILGEADYLTENRESLDVTNTFLKLMDNAAANVCVRACTDDLTITPEAGRRFVKFIPPATATAAEKADAVKKNLRRARYLLHAVYVPPNETAGIEDLLALHASLTANDPFVNTTASPLYIWGSICTEMLNDPSFTLY